VQEVYSLGEEGNQEGKDSPHLLVVNMRTISASQIKRFQKCRRVWWLGQHGGKKLRPYSNMIVGIMAHNLLENSILGLKYDLLSDLENHTSQLSEKEIEKVNELVRDKVLYKKLKEIKEKIIGIMRTNEVEIEKYFHYQQHTESGDIEVSGYLDLVDPKTGNVFDLKVGARTLYDMYIRQNYTVQMELYRRGSKELYQLDYLPKVTILSIGLQSGNVVPFEMPILPTDEISRMLNRLAIQMEQEENAKYDGYNGFCEVCGDTHEFVDYSEQDIAFKKNRKKGLTSK